MKFGLPFNLANADPAVIAQWNQPGFRDQRFNQGFGGRLEPESRFTVRQSDFVAPCFGNDPTWIDRVVNGRKAQVGAFAIHRKETSTALSAGLMRQLRATGGAGGSST